MAISTVEKRCPTCKEYKPHTSFYRNTERADGLASTCKACRRAYEQSPAGKARKRRFYQSAQGKVLKSKENASDAHKASVKRYYQTPNGKAAMVRGNRSTAGKAAQARYRATPKAKANYRRYAATTKGKANQARKNASPAGKAGKARYLQAHPDRYRARQAVRNAIRRHELPHPTTLACLHCGGPATQYHHHRSYAPHQVFDVIPLCHRCHVEAHH